MSKQYLLTYQYQWTITFCTYLYSVGTHHRNILKLLVTMSRVTFFIPQAHTGNRISQN